VLVASPSRSGIDLLISRIFAFSESVVLSIVELSDVLVRAEGLCGINKLSPEDSLRVEVFVVFRVLL